MYHNGNMQFPKRKPQYAKEETKLNLIVIKEKAVKMTNNHITFNTRETDNF